jgi:hypothetical protein
MNQYEKVYHKFVDMDTARETRELEERLERERRGDWFQERKYKYVRQTRYDEAKMQELMPRAAAGR